MKSSHADGPDPSIPPDARRALMEQWKRNEHFVTQLLRSTGGAVPLGSIDRLEAEQQAIEALLGPTCMDSIGMHSPRAVVQLTPHAKRVIAPRRWRGSAGAPVAR